MIDSFPGGGREWGRGFYVVTRIHRPPQQLHTDFDFRESAPTTMADLFLNINQTKVFVFCSTVVQSINNTFLISHGLATLTSQGDSTPTAVYDIDASYPWNSRGDGLLMESLDFPVALVTGDSREDVRSRAAWNGDIGEPSIHALRPPS